MRITKTHGRESAFSNFTICGLYIWSEESTFDTVNINNYAAKDIITCGNCLRILPKIAQVSFNFNVE